MSSTAPDAGKAVLAQARNAPLSEADWENLRERGFRVDSARGVILTGEGIVALRSVTPADDINENTDGAIGYALSKLPDWKEKWDKTKSNSAQFAMHLCAAGRDNYDLFRVSHVVHIDDRSKPQDATIHSGRTPDFYASDPRVSADARPNFFEMLGDGGEIPVAGIEDQLREKCHKRIGSLYASSLDNMIEHAEEVFHKQRLKTAAEFAAKPPSKTAGKPSGKGSSNPDGATGHVDTAAAKAAVEGHEEEILAAIGVPWGENGLDKIDCPYPDHGGENDWRLLPNGRAICTCIRKPDGSGATDHILDVVSKVEGISFEAAKIRCAGIIDRPDLIRETTGTGKGMKQDAESLLNAPAESRDDELPPAYLAHRLGIQADTVLMPATAAVGIRALGYFEQKRGGNPFHVGDHPCAVFEQRDAKGGRHALRIYVAPEGAGKADLGKGRDPKKSCTAVKFDRTAGRAAIWGDPSRARLCLLAEGIETGAAVAHAFRAEIEAGEIYVAAISAAGVRKFVPYPETKRVVAAADRDEKAEAGKQPSREGEKAARTFGLDNRDRVEVAIALPGVAGTKADWLDVLRADGVEAVRAGILAAEGYVPSEADTAASASKEVIDRIALEYPLPDLETQPLFYDVTRTGRCWVHKTVKRGSGASAEWVSVPVSSPFGVTYRLRFVDQADAYGLRIVVEDMSGRRREIDVERSEFARQAASDTRAMLFKAGLRTEDDGDLVAVKALKAADPKDEITVVKRPGWHALDGAIAQIFACPNGAVVGAREGQALELSVNSRIGPAVALGGSLDGWQAAVAAAAEVKGCPHWALAAAAGFAGTIVSLTGLDTCGINFSGRTSGGKTTAQRLAVSAWSRATLQSEDSLLRSARATANGIEGVAARSSGMILAFDELGHVTGKELGKTIYSLASGVGKTRMSADAQLRASNTWSTFVILSAEKSLEEKVRGDGGEWFGGMAARIPDVDTTGIDRSVQEPVLSRINAVDRNYGHAGPAFVREIVFRGLNLRADEIRADINRATDKIAGPAADAAQRRAALPFAIIEVSGRMAREFGILPEVVDVEGAVRWAWGRFTGSTDAIALDPDVQAVENIRTWIAERWESEIHYIDRDETKTKSRNSLAWYDDDAIYIPRNRIVEAAGGALKETEIGRVLNAQNLIAKRKASDCNFVAYVPVVGPVKAYALTRSEFRPVVAEEDKSM